MKSNHTTAPWTVFCSCANSVPQLKLFCLFFIWFRDSIFWFELSLRQDNCVTAEYQVFSWVTLSLLLDSPTVFFEIHVSISVFISGSVPNFCLIGFRIYTMSVLHMYVIKFVLSSINLMLIWLFNQLEKNPKMWRSGKDFFCVCSTLGNLF